MPSIPAHSNRFVRAVQFITKNTLLPTPGRREALRELLCVLLSPSQRMVTVAVGGIKAALCADLKLISLFAEAPGFTIVPNYTERLNSIFFKRPSKTHFLLPVIINGFREDPETGKTTYSAVVLSETAQFDVRLKESDLDMLSTIWTVKDIPREAGSELSDSLSELSDEADDADEADEAVEAEDEKGHGVLESPYAKKAPVEESKLFGWWGKSDKEQV